MDRSKESGGIETLLVDTRPLSRVPGRKTNVEDCQWIQTLHSHGLLQSSYRPSEQISQLRTLVRQKAVLVREQADWVRRCRRSEEEIAEFLTGHWRSDHLFNLEQSLLTYDALGERMAAYEKEIQQRLQALTPPARKGVKAPPLANRNKRKAMKRRDQDRGSLASCGHGTQKEPERPTNSSTKPSDSAA